MSGIANNNNIATEVYNLNCMGYHDSNPSFYSVFTVLLLHVTNNIYYNIIHCTKQY